MLRRLLRTAFDTTRAGVLAIVRSRELALENLALRQQLASLSRQPHPRPDVFDRAFWVSLSTLWSGWRQSLSFVTPETVVRWHRAGFRAFWRLKSKPGPPEIAPEVRKLIVTMAKENSTWGAPRIHGELLKLGHKIAESTVSKYMPRPRPEPGMTWGNFLALDLEGAVGIDFFDIPTATFEVIRGFLVIDHKNRKLLHVGATKQPTDEWTANQLPEAFPFEGAPDFLFRDRDSIFGPRFRGKAEALGIVEVISAPRSPWENPFAERVIGSIRRDLLDHVIVLNEQHAVRLLRAYAEYYLNSRTHLSLGKDTPAGRAVQGPECGAKVIALPILGGLHHRYERRAA